MADPIVIPPATPAPAPAVAPELSTVASDIGDDITLAKKLLADYKAGGKDALLTDLPALTAAATKQFSDVKAALPVIAAGYKTTEFWLIVAVLLANTIILGVTGKALPLDINIAVTALVGIYTVVRGLLKGNATAAVATAVAATPAK